MANITVLGSGSWGCALAMLAHRNQHKIRVWGVDHDQISRINRTRYNEGFLKGIRIPDEIEFTVDLNEALAQPDLILVVVPAHAVRPVARELSRHDLNDALIINAAKGIENDTLRRMSEVLAEELPPGYQDKIATLSGPSLALEACQGIPTLVTIAGKNEHTNTTAQSLLISERFRIYTNDDIIGVELCGSLKNVTAIAAGALDGLGFGDNTKGALITRGLAEMARLGRAMGAKMDTFAGLAGMGDLITTCQSRQSRNRHVGEQIGRGRKLRDILEEMVMVAEGVYTTKSAYQLARKYDVEMPIVEQVHAVLFEDKDPRQATADLMLRDAKPEVWW